MNASGPCLCGDPYCSSCGPAQGFYKCEHGYIPGECEDPECENYHGDEEEEHENN